ncbi:MULTISPECIES: hypothetical protein [unclassified Chitinophaga]|uniref:hypothetical protein n=1 Tax=unclassified Chitinophaga TaxID=2619133 RepID=UPI00300FA0FD
MRLQKMTGIIIALMMCMSCNQFRESIHDTLYGSDTDSSYKDLPSGEEETSTTTSSSTSTHLSTSSSTTHTTVVEQRNGTTIIYNSTKTSGDNDFLGNAGKLVAAERALRELPAFAGKGIHLYRSIHFYEDGRINVTIQHPQNPEYIDEYNYSKGKWEEPKPVQMSVRDNISESLVSLDDISFASAAAVYRNYNRKAEDVAGAKPLTHIYGIFHGNSITWYPQSINGSREKYFISFTPNGSLKDYYRE